MPVDANRIGMPARSHVRETPRSCAAPRIMMTPPDAAHAPAAPGHRPFRRRLRHLLLVRLGVALLLPIAATTVGCASTASPRVVALETSASAYDDAFEATLDTLRREGYRLERVDRRFGIITTKPRTTPTLFEPWRGWGNPVDTAIEGTLHHEQRVLRVAFRPADPAEAPESAGGGVDLTPPVPIEGTTVAPAYESATVITPTRLNPLPFQPARHQGQLRVEVTATVEREQIAGRRIETTSVRHSSITLDPRWQERGISVRSWNAISRDPWLERQIMTALVDAGATPEASAENDGSGGPAAGRRLLFRPIMSSESNAGPDSGRDVGSDAGPDAPIATEAEDASGS